MPAILSKRGQILGNYCAVLEKDVLPSIEMTRISVPMPTLLFLRSMYFIFLFLEIILDAILSGFDEWLLEAIDCCSIDFIDALVCQYLDGFRLEAYQVQEAIRWQQVLLGRITTKWEQLANNNGSEDAGKKGICGLVEWHALPGNMD